MSNDDIINAFAPQGHSEDKLAQVEAAEARYQAWKQAVIESYRLAGARWIQLMDSSFQTVSGPEGERQYGIISLSRPWYRLEGRLKKGSTIVLIRMHKGSRMAYLYELVKLVNKGDATQWHCRYVTVNLLDGY